LQKHKFPFPSFDEQEAIVNYLDRETAHINSLVMTIQEQIAKLGIYRQALITAAVTGKIDVRGETSH
jgi:type I restriction enzyme S subunit